MAKQARAREERIEDEKKGGREGGRCARGRQAGEGSRELVSECTCVHLGAQMTDP